MTNLPDSPLIQSCFQAIPKVISAVILATDIRGFTKCVENNSLKKMGRFIDEYITTTNNIFNTISKEVNLKEGTIIFDKFLGDGLLFFINLDKLDNEESLSIILLKSIFEIKNSFNRLKDSKAYNFPEIGLGISIEKGDILYGLFGRPPSDSNLVCPSNWHGQVSGLGAPINRTFRILSRAGRGQLLITKDIWRDYLKDEIISTMINPIIAKGIVVPIIPYLIFRKRIDTDDRIACCDKCNQYKYCVKNYIWGNERENIPGFGENIFRSKNEMRCDQRTLDDKSEQLYCNGCDFVGNCSLNLFRGLMGEKKGICCDRCNGFEGCFFSFHRGKNGEKMACCNMCNCFKQDGCEL